MAEVFLLSTGEYSYHSYECAFLDRDQAQGVADRLNIGVKENSSQRYDIETLELIDAGVVLETSTKWWCNMRYDPNKGGDVQLSVNSINQLGPSEPMRVNGFHQAVGHTWEYFSVTGSGPDPEPLTHACADLMAKLRAEALEPTDG